MESDILISIISGLSGAFCTVVVLIITRKKRSSEILVAESESKHLDSKSDETAINNMTAVSKIERELRQYFEEKYKELLARYDDILALVKNKVDISVYLNIVEERDLLLQVAELQKATIRKLENDIGILKDKLKAKYQR